MGQFAIDIARFVEKAKGDVDLVVRKVSLDIFTRVIRKTPVDTGRARGNWSCAIGSFTPKQTGTLDKSGAGPIGAAAQTLQGAKAGTVVYLTNTLPYILRLEHGYSKQAPQGMVAKTLREFPGVVESAVGDVRR